MMRCEVCGGMHPRAEWTIRAGMFKTLVRVVGCDTHPGPCGRECVGGKTTGAVKQHTKVACAGCREEKLS